MMQMPNEFRTRGKGRTTAVAAAAAVLALSCVLGRAQEPGTLPETSPQQGVLRNDMGPRAMQRQGYPALPPRPGTPESRLPPTPPTQAPAQPSPVPGTPAPGQTAVPSSTVATMSPGETTSSTPRAAVVSFQDGLLEVRANDSSLHQILRSVARHTGMKITDGVSDLRVFGNYGPAPAATVLATLLDGTGVNMLLQTTPAQVPEKLVLTPQTGGASPASLDMTMNDDAGDGISATPPAPSASAGENPRQAPSANSGPKSVPQPYNNVNGSPANTSPTASTFPTTNSVPLDSLPTPSTAPPTAGIVDAPNPPPPGSTTSQSPNGVATPESIYQQLLQLQKQQQQKQQSGAGSTPP